MMANLLNGIFSRNGAGIPAMSLNRSLRWQLRHRLAMLGWPGIVAISLLIASPLIYFSVIRPLQAHLDTAQRSVAAAQEQERTGKTARAGADTPREQLTEFYKFFPKEKIAPRWLGKLVTVAEENGLALDEGEYKVSSDKVGQLLRYRITLPVQGQYPQIRKFLAALPAEIPAMALENVQFERKDIVDTTVQVKIRLVLYLVQES